MSQYDIPFGTWFAQVRKANGLTQARVAEILGVKQPIVSRIENGLTQTITVQQAESLSPVFGLPASEILDRAGTLVPGAVSDQSVYITDSSGRRWRVLSGGGKISPETAAALGALGVLTEVDGKDI